MLNLAAVIDGWVRDYSQAGSLLVPAVSAGVVFLVAGWSIRKQVRAILGGK